MKKFQKLTHLLVIVLSLSAIVVSGCKKDDSNGSEKDIIYGSLNKTVTAIADDPLYPYQYHGGYAFYLGHTTSYLDINFDKNTEPSNISYSMHVGRLDDCSFLADNVDNLIALSAGTEIGPSTSGRWIVQATGQFKLGTINSGNIKAGSGDKYFAVRMERGSTINYGWVLVNYAADALSLTIKEYAYNEVKDSPINVGEK